MGRTLPRPRTIGDPGTPQVVAGAGVLLQLGVTPAQAGPTPRQKCQAAKNKIAGQFAACRQNAEAKFATAGDGVTRDAALTKCGVTFISAWRKAIVKAARVRATWLTCAPLLRFATVTFARSVDQNHK